MMTTYNTGRVRIGLCYIRPAMAIEGDAVTVQAALLDPRTARKQTVMQRILGKLWAWL